MNPTAALMLSHELEQDRRRAIEARRHRFIDSDSVDRPTRHRRTSVWTMLLHMSLRVPRLRPAR
jgi:hypothetical protein